MAQVQQQQQQSGVSARYDLAKRVVTDLQFQPAPSPGYGGVILDLFTASAVVTVCEALSPQNLAKVDAVPLPVFLDFVWKQVSS